MTIRLAGPVLSGVVAAGLLLGSAPALAARAPAVVTVPCQAAALAADLAAATSGETLQLAPSCRYILTAGLPSITGSLTIHGNGATVERSYALGTTDFAILTVLRSGDVDIRQLNFRNGDSAYGGAIDNGGGPAGEASSSVTVTGGTFTGNTAGLGGALYNNTGATLIVRGATFTGNSASAGGGIYNAYGSGPAAGFTTLLEVTGSTFTRNSSSGDGYGEAGGGIGNAGDATVASSTFTRNTSPSGGGICNQQAALLKVTSSDFSENSRSGLYNQGDSSVTESTFTGNSTPSRGGGIINTSEGPTLLTVTATSFTGNSAGEGGGGIYNYDGAYVIRDTFTGNTAPVGGGIDNDWSATVADSTFLRNLATTGGGLYNDCQATVSGSTFAQNRASMDGGGIDTTDVYPQICFPPTSLALTHTQIRGNVAGADGGGLYAAGAAAARRPGTVTVSGGGIRDNVAGGNGGGIYNIGDSTVSLASAAVAGNHPDNCAPAGSVPGCAG